ncbi:MAG: hypothetical protein WCP45_16430 [Verrucomicrobiota bacterium]
MQGIEVFDLGLDGGEVEHGDFELNFGCWMLDVGCWIDVLVGVGVVESSGSGGNIGRSGG